MPEITHDDVRNLLEKLDAVSINVISVGYEGGGGGVGSNTVSGGLSNVKPYAEYGDEKIYISASMYAHLKKFHVNELTLYDRIGFPEMDPSKKKHLIMAGDKHGNGWMTLWLFLFIVAAYPFLIFSEWRDARRKKRRDKIK